MKTETAPETSEAVMDPLPYEAIRVVQLPILGSTFNLQLLPALREGDGAERRGENAGRPVVGPYRFIVAGIAFIVSLRKLFNSATQTFQLFQPNSATL